MRIASTVMVALLLSIGATPAHAHEEELAPEIQAALDRWAEEFDRAVAEREVWPKDVQRALKDLADVEAHGLAHYCQALGAKLPASPAAGKRQRVLRSVITAREYAKVTSAPGELGFLLTSPVAVDRVNAIARLAREDFTDDLLSCAIRLSKDDRPEVRVGAARLLTMWTSFQGYDDRAINAADALLVDREPGVAISAAASLVHWDDPRVFRRLLNRVKDERVPRKGLHPSVAAGDTPVGPWLRDFLSFLVRDRTLFGDAALRADESLESWRERVGPECGPRLNPKLWTLIFDEAVTVPPGGESVVVERDGVLATLRYEYFREGHDGDEPVLTSKLRLTLHLKDRREPMDFGLGGPVGAGWGAARDSATYFWPVERSPEGMVFGEAFHATLMAVPSVHGGVRSKVRVWHRRDRR